MSKTSTYVGVEYEASGKWRAIYGLPDGIVKLVLAGLYNTQIEAALAFDKYARSVLDPKEASRVVNFTEYVFFKTFTLTQIFNTLHLHICGYRVALYL